MMPSVVLEPSVRPFEGSVTTKMFATDKWFASVHLTLVTTQIPFTIYPTKRGITIVTDHDRRFC